jgi:orotidine-5'-phosphate decarboxylase
MNHIEFYENLINDFDVDFNVRHQVRMFNELNIDKALQAFEHVKVLLDLKKHDLNVLKQEESK